MFARRETEGLTPIVCSLVPRKIWKDGQIVRGSEDYGQWAAAVARAEDVPFLDLNEIIARRYDALGPQAVEGFFADERTHTSAAGAELNARSVVAALKGLDGCPPCAWLSEKAADVAPEKP